MMKERKWLVDLAGDEAAYPLALFPENFPR